MGAGFIHPRRLSALTKVIFTTNKVLNVKELCVLCQCHLFDNLIVRAKELNPQV